MKKVSELCYPRAEASTARRMSAGQWWLTRFPHEGMGTGGAALVAHSGRGYVTVTGENYYTGDPASSALPLPRLPSWK